MRTRRTAENPREPTVASSLAQCKLYSLFLWNKKRNAQSAENSAGFSVVGAAECEGRGSCGERCFISSVSATKPKDETKNPGKLGCEERSGGFP